MRHVSRTHRGAHDWSFDRNQICWHREPTSQRAISPVNSGTTFSVCWTSWTLHSLLSAWPALLRPCRRGQHSKKDLEKMNEWLRDRNQCGIWCWRLSIGLQQCWVRVHLTSGDTWRTEFKLGSLISTGKTCSERFEWKHSIEFFRVAFRCKSELQCTETCGGNDKESHCYKNVSPQLEVIPELCSPPWESLFTCTTETESSTRRRCAWHRRQRYVSDYECGSTSRTRLWREIAHHENTDFEKIKQLFNIVQKFILDERQEMYGISTNDWNAYHRWELLFWTTEQSSCRKQRYTFSLIRYFVLAKFKNILDQWKPGSKILCESGCAYNGITDFVTNMLMKVQHVAVSENSVHDSCVPYTVIWTWNSHGLTLHVPGSTPSEL